MSNDDVSEFLNDSRNGLFRGVKLQFKRYRIYRKGWEHDHCTRCGATFAEFDGPGILHYGYATCDDYIYGAEYEWICEKCFALIDPFMEWKVIGHSPERVRRRHKEADAKLKYPS